MNESAFNDTLAHTRHASPPNVWLIHMVKGGMYRFPAQSVPLHSFTTPSRCVDPRQTPNGCHGRLTPHGHISDVHHVIHCFRTFRTNRRTLLYNPHQRSHHYTSCTVESVATCNKRSKPPPVHTDRRISLMPAAGGMLSFDASSRHAAPAVIVVAHGTVPSHCHGAHARDIMRQEQVPLHQSE